MAGGFRFEFDYWEVDVNRLSVGAGLGEEPVSITPYCSDEYFEAERERVFRRSWLLVGRVEEVPTAGDFFTRDLPILAASLLIVRGDDGVVRAFYNSCQHRGNKVTSLASGQLPAFSCGFHGWTYDLTGKLVYVPDEENFFNFCRDRHVLKALGCEIWNGFIFIHADPESAESLESFIGAEMDSQVAGFPFEEMEPAAAYEFELESNWKFVAEAFQEAYHVVQTHFDTVADRSTVSRWDEERAAALRGTPLPSPGMDKDAPAAHKFCSMRLGARHRSMSVFGKPSVAADWPPALAVAMAHLPNPASAGPNGLNPQGDENWGADLQFMFPNVELLMVHPSWYALLFFWPLATGRTKFEFRFYRQKPRNAGELLALEYIEANFRDVIREDVASLEKAQQMFASGVINELYFSDQEAPARHSYEVVDRLVRAEA